MYGHNIVQRAETMPWYHGPTVVDHLDTVPVGDREAEKPFRLPIQWVNRPNLDFRGFAGVIVSGTVRVGDSTRLLPSGRSSYVQRVIVGDRDVDMAVAGQSVTVTLADEVDVSRGDVLAASDAPPEVADQFEATIV